MEEGGKAETTRETQICAERAKPAYELTQPSLFRLYSSIRRERLTQSCCQGMQAAIILLRGTNRDADKLM